MSLFVELKRRNVFKVGIAYLVASWLLLQLTEVLTELLEIGPEVGKIVIVLLIVGFLPALIFAWAFEMTPEGIKREHEVDRSQSITPKTGRKLDFTIIGMLVLIAGYFIWEARFMDREEMGSEPFSQEILEQGSATESEKRALTPIEAPAEPADARKSIVVLPFVNMSNDPDQEFFSDGLSEEILNALVKIDDLRVISRTSAFAFKDKEMSIPEIAGQLGVSHVLEGSVRKAGNDVRITAQLIDVSNDSHLWSDAYNRSLENVFEIQEEISLAIAEELQVTLGEGTADAPPTDNLEAYQTYLRGRHLYQNRGPNNLDQAIKVLQEAVAMDPEFADAWATLAGATAVRAFQIDEGHESMFGHSRQAASRAIEIDPQHGFGHAVLGLLLMREVKWEEAMQMLNLAVELNPYETNSLLWKGIALLSLGYTTEALSVFKQAEYVDPVWSLLQIWMGSTYIILGDMDALEEMTERHRQMEIEPDTGMAAWQALVMGDLDQFEELNAAADMESIGTDLFTRATADGLRHPEKRQQSIDLILANRDQASFNSVFFYLWILEASDEGIDELLRQIAMKRGLRLATSFGTLWGLHSRKLLNDPGLPAMFEQAGLADYWRRHGNPDLCRVDGDNIECGAQ